MNARDVMLWALAGAVVALSIAFVLLGAGCTGPGSDKWLERCVAAGGHEYTQYVYKGSVILCLSVDGRIVELTED